MAQYSYDLLGRLGQLTLANGAQTTYTYDEVNRLLELETWSGGTKINGFDYTLDRLGLRKGVTETLGTQTRSITYDYDGLLRLTNAVEVQQQSYTYAYDLAGNRTEVRVNGAVTESRSYNAANQVSGWLYDEAGNRCATTPPPTATMASVASLGSPPAASRATTRTTSTACWWTTG